MLDFSVDFECVSNPTPKLEITSPKCLFPQCFCACKPLKTMCVGKVFRIPIRSLGSIHPNELNELARRVRRWRGIFSIGQQRNTNIQDHTKRFRAHWLVNIMHLRYLFIAAPTSRLRSREYQIAKTTNVGIRCVQFLTQMIFKATGSSGSIAKPKGF